MMNLQTIATVERERERELSFKGLKKMQNNKGITLIALIITIIVLFILAGVAISAVIGENGIFSQAVNAVIKTEQAKLEEDVGYAITDRDGAKYSGEETEELGYYLEQISGATVEQLAEDVWYVTRNSAGVTVYDDEEIVTGKVDVWKDSAVEAPVIEEDENGVFNWYIYTSAQLKFLADFTNNGSQLTGDAGDLTSLVETAGYNTEDVTLTEDTVIYLMNDLDLGARQTDGELTSGTEWTPIGKTSACIATFEGNGYTIRGVYVNSTTYYNGIFGMSYTIQNLTVKDSYIEGDVACGGIVGLLVAGGLYECHNENTSVCGASVIGGVVGVTTATGGTILSCSSDGSVYASGRSGWGSQAGGILGECGVRNLSISECVNSGVVKGDSQHVGGILGVDFGNTEIYECINEGSVTGNGYSVGGICGTVENDGVISNCRNYARVEGKYEVGGIVGLGGWYGSMALTKCFNSGAVIGEACVGGILRCCTDVKGNGGRC